MKSSIEIIPGVVPEGTVILNEKETAKVLRVYQNTLAVWRSRGEGPRFIKRGRLVGYMSDAIRDYLKKRERASTKGASK